MTNLEKAEEIAGAFMDAYGLSKSTSGYSLLAHNIAESLDAKDDERDTLRQQNAELLEVCYHVINHSLHLTFSCAHQSEFHAGCSRCFAERAIRRAEEKKGGGK